MSEAASSTALPPVRQPASAAQFTKGGQKPTLGGKVLTKQQLNQIAAREKRQREAAKLGITEHELCIRNKQKKLARGGKTYTASAASSSSSSSKKKAKADHDDEPMPAASAPASAPAAPKKPQEEKKRKKPSESESDSSDSDDATSDSSSDSGSDDDDDDEPQRKAIKASAASTPASAPKVQIDGEDADEDDDKPVKVDTKGMSAKEAKAAVVAAKRAARALKKEKNRAKAEAAGVHPTQRDLQLMNRDLQAEKLWTMYCKHRKSRGEDLTPLEMDDRLVGKSIAQIPKHEQPESHSFKMLPKHLKSMYGAKFDEQVCGGTIQPALSTKAEKLKAKYAHKDLERDDPDAAEEEEEKMVAQQQKLIDDPTIGAPYVIIITASAIRAVEIGRAFKKLEMNTRIVKLFAKHLKVTDQQAELSHDVRVCIGTPKRLLTLSQSGYLKWSRARLIVWDIGKTRKLQVAEAQEARRIKNKLKKGLDIGDADPHNVQVKPQDAKGDQKMFTLLTLHDVSDALWKLYEQFIHPVVVQKQTGKLVLM